MSLFRHISADKKCLSAIDRVLDAPNIELDPVRRHRARRLLSRELPKLVSLSKKRQMTAAEKSELRTLLPQVVKYHHLSRRLFDAVFHSPPILTQADLSIESVDLWLWNLDDDPTIVNRHAKLTL